MGADTSGVCKISRQMKTQPADDTARNTFAKKLERNFSVIAAAGTGKTTAITKRIVEIAKIDGELLRQGRKAEWLPRLVVVTFTNRAADEMQQRTRQRIFEQNPSPSLLATFNRAFFGTIHSFCVKLLAEHGHHLGLPSRLDLISDDEELWSEFVQRTESIGDSLSPENRKALLRHVQLRDLMELGRRGKLPLSLEQRDLDYPKSVDLAALHNFPAQPKWTRIIKLKALVLEWQEQFNSGADLLPLIECTAEGRFLEQWEETFRDFNQWLSYCALNVAGEVQAKYRQFRAEHGFATFDDQIAFALQLTENREAISRIRAKDYVVILDEAQDTDPHQFDILTEITRPPGTHGHWIDNPQDSPPRPGHFCMVGDFQQSIYGDRADLRHYQRVHDALIDSGSAEKLEFPVTFRLDQKQIDFINECFRDILNHEDQVGFIALQPRPEKLPGQVVRLEISAEGLDDEALETQRARAEAIQLARWIKKTNLEKLRARSWEQVAILCPRKKWFAPIADALRDPNIDLDSQIQSETDVKGDSPAHAWFTALLTIMTQPRCAFEIVGVLREIFGISDNDLAIFSEGYGDRFQIERETGADEVLPEPLNLLTRIHADIRDKPLFTAVKQIVESTQLRERLRTLPAEDFDDLDHELDKLLQLAADAESEGKTLEEFAELLGANFTAEREASPPRAGAIQLITSQKAKGLEWDVVIVPFFSRPIYTRDDDFPRVVAAGCGQDAVVAFSKRGVPSAAKEAMEKSRAQEMERLLYVALTRARHTLVLAMDHELFAKADGSAHSASLTGWFRSDRNGANAAHVARLEAKATACSETRAHQMGQTLPGKESQRIADLPKPVLAKATLRASEFFRQRNPSRFIAGDAEMRRTGADAWKEREIEFRARTLPSAATRYGVWWHEFMQLLPWNDENWWQSIFESRRSEAPEEKRFSREWNVFRKCFAGEAAFPRSGFVAHSELPFFWRIDGTRCLEGIVDLALVDPSTRRWFIIDWKTNEIKPNQIDKLREHYLPQLAAYWKALGDITNLKVDAAIYSTAAGSLIRYEPEELVAGWTRLEKLPVDHFDLCIASRTVQRQRPSQASQLEFPDL
jgi:ATP-dependent helicase/nuclease subunit A